MKALQVAVSNGEEVQFDKWDGSYFATTRIAAARAYKEAGITRPREQVSLVDVHDCFSVTELVTMEDLQLSRRGHGDPRRARRLLRCRRRRCRARSTAGSSASAIRSARRACAWSTRCTCSCRAAPARASDPAPTWGVTHNLGGFPSQNVAAIAVLGSYGA